MKCKTCKHKNSNFMGKCQYCKWLKRDDLYEPIEPKEVGNAEDNLGSRAECQNIS